MCSCPTGTATGGCTGATGTRSTNGCVTTPTTAWPASSGVAAGVADLPVRVVAKGAFSFAAQVAAGYRRGRAFLVGDAAQRMTPRGGMGMNTAVAEGHDLGWKLAWVLRGWAGPDLLDTYEAEWRPVGARRTARSADPSPEASGAEALAEDLNGRIPHAWLSHGEGRSSTLDLLGPGLTLLTGPDGRGWSEAAKATATPFPLEVAVLDRPAAHAVGIGPGGAVLVRPDAQMVACWPTAGAPGAELAEALSSWFGRRPTAADEDRQVTLIVEQLAVAALDADLHAPGPLARPDDLPARDDREPGHAGMRTSTDASSGFTSTSPVSS